MFFNHISSNNLKLVDFFFSILYIFQEHRFMGNQHLYPKAEWVQQLTGNTGNINSIL